MPTGAQPRSRLSPRPLRWQRPHRSVPGAGRCAGCALPSTPRAHAAAPHPLHGQRPVHRPPGGLSLARHPSPAAATAQGQVGPWPFPCVTAGPWGGCWPRRQAVPRVAVPRTEDRAWEPSCCPWLGRQSSPPALAWWGLRPRPKPSRLAPRCPDGRTPQRVFPGTGEWVSGGTPSRRQRTDGQKREKLPAPLGGAAHYSRVLASSGRDVQARSPGPSLATPLPTGKCPHAHLGTCLTEVSPAGTRPTCTFLLGAGSCAHKCPVQVACGHHQAWLLFFFFYRKDPEEEPTLSPISGMRGHWVVSRVREAAWDKGSSQEQRPERCWLRAGPRDGLGGAPSPTPPPTPSGGQPSLSGRTGPGAVRTGSGSPDQFI